jgi:hypothetical protein
MSLSAEAERKFEQERANYKEIAMDQLSGLHHAIDQWARLPFPGDDGKILATMNNYRLAWMQHSQCLINQEMARAMAASAAKAGASHER